MAGAPSNGHTLFGILHLAQELTRAVTQYQCVRLCAHADAAGRLPGARPDPREGLTSRKTTTPSATSQAGEVPATFADMGANAVAFIKALRLAKVDVLGFSISACRVRLY
jgi:hypothetical protein